MGEAVKTPRSADRGKLDHRQTATASGVAALGVVTLRFSKDNKRNIHAACPRIGGETWLHECYSLSRILTLADFESDIECHIDIS